MTIDERVDAVQQAEAVAAQATADAKRARAVLQFLCPHDNVVEGAYRSGLVYADPPFCVCTTCGLAETGWGTGYKVLTPPKGTGPIDRAAAQAFVRGVHRTFDVRTNRRTLLAALGLTEGDIA